MAKSLIPSFDEIEAPQATIPAFDDIEPGATERSEAPTFGQMATEATELWLTDPIHRASEQNKQAYDLAERSNLPVATIQRRQGILEQLYTKEQMQDAAADRRAEKDDAGVSGYWQELVDATARGTARVGAAFKRAQAAITRAKVPGAWAPMDTPQMAQAREARASRYEQDAEILWSLARHPELAQREGKLNWALNVVGETLPYMTATTVAYTVAGPMGGFAVGGLVEGHSAYMEAVEEGVDPQTAKAIGMGVGIVSGAIESVGGKMTEEVLERIIKARIKQRAAQGAALFATGTLVEAAEEAGQEIAAITGEEVYRDVDWNERIKRIGSAMAGGAFLGGTMRGAQVGASRLMGVEERPGLEDELTATIQEETGLPEGDARRVARDAMESQYRPEPQQGAEGETEAHPQQATMSEIVAEATKDLPMATELARQGVPDAQAEAAEAEVPGVPGDSLSDIAVEPPEGQAQERSVPDYQVAQTYARYERQSPDDATADWEIAPGIMVRKVTEVPVPAGARIPTGREIHAKVSTGSGGSVIVIKKGLPPGDYERAIRHELEHIARRDNIDWREEWPELAPTVAPAAPQEVPGVPGEGQAAGVVETAPAGEEDTIVQSFLQATRDEQMTMAHDMTPTQWEMVRQRTTDKGALDAIANAEYYAERSRRTVWKNEPLVEGRTYSTENIFESGGSEDTGYRRIENPEAVGPSDTIKKQQQWTQLPNGQIVRAANSWRTEHELVPRATIEKYRGQDWADTALSSPTLQESQTVAPEAQAGEGSQAWETTERTPLTDAQKKPRRRYDGKSMEQAIRVAYTSASETGEPKYVYATAYGLRVEDSPPPRGQNHFEVTPQGELLRRVDARMAQQGADALAEGSKDRRRKILQNRVLRGEDVAGMARTIEEFRGESWADEALSKLEAETPPVRPSEPRETEGAPEVGREGVPQAGGQAEAAEPTPTTPDEVPPGQGASNPEATPEADHGEPRLTSARQAWVNQHRGRLGLDGINSKSRRSWAKALADAWEQGIPGEALRIAAEITAKPRPLTDVETAGLLIRMVELENEHAALMGRIGPEKDAAVVADLSARTGTIESEYDALSRALHASGTEKGRALNAQKMTINEDFSLVAIKARAKAAKGAALSEKEVARLESLERQLAEQGEKVETLEKELNKIKAEKMLQKLKGAKRAVATERSVLTNRVAELMKAGCY